MKKFSKILIAVAFVCFGAAGLASGNADALSSTCTAKAIGARASAFNVHDHKATVKFKVSGKSNCRVKLSNSMFYAPSMNGRPYSKQILYQRHVQVYKPGTYIATVAVPLKSTKAKGCYYQVDLSYGSTTKTPVLAYGHGKLDCSKPKPKKIQVCELATKKIVTIEEKQFDANKYSKNLDDCKETPPPVKIHVCELATKTIVTINENDFDSNLYSKDLNDCATPPPPSKITVCELSTKRIVTINESEFDSSTYSKDLNDCTVVPVTPTQPKEEKSAQLPHTGPTDMILKLIGVTSLTGAASYYIASRRQ